MLQATKMRRTGRSYGKILTGQVPRSLSTNFGQPKGACRQHMNSPGTEAKLFTRLMRPHGNISYACTMGARLQPHVGIHPRGRESNELAMIVDQLIYPTEKRPPQLARRGLRRYTEWRSYVENDGDQLTSHSHRGMVRYFVSEMMDRIPIDLRSGRGHVPLAAPVIEIGFSIDTYHRLREHRRHMQSNCLINLADLYPSTFRLQQLVIYTCYRPSQP